MHVPIYICMKYGIVSYDILNNGMSCMCTQQIDKYNDSCSAG